MRILCTSPIKYNNNQYLRTLNFRSKVVKCFPVNSANIDLKNKIDFFEENTDKFKKLGEGQCSEVFLLEPDTLVIKKELPTYKAGDNFENETKMLSKLPQTFINTQHLKTWVKTEKNNTFLISTFKKGMPANVESNPLTKIAQKHILDSLFELDKANIYHMDLSNNNILLDEYSANIIDYQWAKEFYPYNKYIENQENGIIFPRNTIPNNLQHYESSGFSSYLYNYYMKNGKENTRNFFKEYLKQKSEYFDKRYHYFKGIAKEKGIYYSNTLNLNKEKQHNDLSYTPLKYEKALSLVYQDPNDDIVDIELSRIEMLRSDKKAYHYVDSNIKEKINPFNSVPYFANAIFSVNQFRNILSKYEKKYQNNKYISRYIRYNKEIAERYASLYNIWYRDSFIFLNRVAKNQLNFYEKDRIVDIEKNNLSYFDKFKTFNELLMEENKKSKRCEQAIIINPNDEIFEKLENSVAELNTIPDFDGKEKAKEIQNEIDTMIKDERIIDTFTSLFVYRRYIADLYEKCSFDNNHVLLGNIANNIDNAINLIENRLITAINTKEVLFNNKDYKLLCIAKNSKEKSTVNKEKSETENKQSAKKEHNQSIFYKIINWWSNL